MSAKPTRVAMDDWQLHDLKKALAAVDVQKKARPPRQDVANPERRDPDKSGMESNAPIIDACQGRVSCLSFVVCSLRLKVVARDARWKCGGDARRAEEARVDVEQPRRRWCSEDADRHHDRLLLDHDNRTAISQVKSAFMADRAASR
ncbi:unnamed protein product [Jaminaea pallidilutea]